MFCKLTSVYDHGTITNTIFLTFLHTIYYSFLAKNDAANGNGDDTNGFASILELESRAQPIDALQGPDPFHKEDSTSKGPDPMPSL